MKEFWLTIALLKDSIWTPEFIIGFCAIMVGVICLAAKVVHKVTGVGNIHEHLE